MKSVSNAYKASMKAMLRNRSYVRITFGNVDTTAATDGEWESNGAASISEFETVDYAYQYGDTYAALELNRWALDGKTLIVPTGEAVQDGFISSLMSDAEGNFSTPPVITREFSLSSTKIPPRKGRCRRIKCQSQNLCGEKAMCSSLKPQDA